MWDKIKVEEYLHGNKMTSKTLAGKIEGNKLERLERRRPEECGWMTNGKPLSQITYKEVEILTLNREA